jgi:hypothetical protein
MYEKKVHFYRYRIGIDILLKMYGKKFTFTAIESISNCYRYRYRYVTDFIDNGKSELSFCPVHIYRINHVISTLLYTLLSLCVPFPPPLLITLSGI